MYSPATRLLTLLDILQARPGITALQLAERLEVNTRSVRRYMLMLQDLGIPVEALRGRYGGYRLRPGFKLPPLMFSDEEALAVTLGLLAARQLGLNDAVPAVEGALRKVERVLPIAIREQVQAVQDAVRMDLLTPHAASDLEQIVLLSKATHEERRVHFAYVNKAGGVSERFFDCYGLVYLSGSWYAVGYCYLRQEIRIFRLDRIRDVQLQPEHFQMPPDFNCLDYTVQAFIAIPDRWQIEVLLETSLEQLRQLVPPTFATLAPQQNGILLRAYVPELSIAVRFLLGLDCPFRVFQPPELLRELEQQAQDILRMVALSRSV